MYDRNCFSKLKAVVLSPSGAAIARTRLLPILPLHGFNNFTQHAEQGITFPNAPLPEGAAALDELQKLSGATFDRHSEQVTDHQKAGGALPERGRLRSGSAA